MASRSISVAILGSLLFFAGCAPARFIEGVRYTADEYGVRNAEILSVAGHEYLRFDAELKSDLEDVLAQPDLEELRAGGSRVLRAANELAVRSADEEIDRMPPAAVADLVRRYEVAESPEGSAGRRAALKRSFANEAHAGLEAELSRLDSAGDAAQARQALHAVLDRIEPPAGDRGKLGRALLAMPLFVPATIGAEMADAEATQREIVADFEHVCEYRPKVTVPIPDDGMRQSADVADLAAMFAPTILQQIDPSAEYPGDDDRIGRVYLTGSPEKIDVNVDPQEPTVYWSAGHAKVGARRYEQLTYVAWYPARPALSANDPSAGRIDGVVVRITLDRYRRPAVYEFVRSCGCYHTLWVAEFVEAAARADFGPPEGDRDFAVQRPDVQRELFLPALVRDDGTRARPFRVFVNAGYHLVMELQPGGTDAAPGEIDERQTYTLLPYESLTRLPLDGGVASMFGADGLVHNAGRSEGWLLAPTGMLSAGQPRQLGTMKIRMDAYDYDDPRLLERNLRLPGGF